MTQNTALSLISAIVIAVGFLVGWCAGALELVPARVDAMATTGASDRSGMPGRESGNDADRVRPGAAMHDQL